MRSAPSPDAGFRIGRSWLLLPPDAPTIHPKTLVPLRVPIGAFGSGEHETTASCLEILEDIPTLTSSTVLDVGCGTGILAIAALARGALQATGIDISRRAAATTRAAANLNGVSDRLHIAAGTLDSLGDAHFSLILANLYGDVVLNEAENMIRVATAHANIVLSGIAWEYAFVVRQRFERLGAQIVDERWLSEFVSMVLRAP